MIEVLDVKNVTKPFWEPMLFVHPAELANYCTEKVCECTSFDWQSVSYFLVGVVAVMWLVSMIELFKRRKLRRRVRELEENEHNRAVQERPSKEIERSDA